MRFASAGANWRKEQHGIAEKRGSGPTQASFIASQAQFTPKTVETQSERDKLMFRIRVRIDPDRSRAHAPSVRSGLPGVAYLRVDPDVAWPKELQGAP